MALFVRQAETFVNDERTGATGSVWTSCAEAWPVWAIHTPPYMRGNGGAARIMQQIVDHLDEHDKEGYLYAKPFERSDKIDASLSITLDALVAFYERFGFVKQPCRDHGYADAQLMVRPCKSEREARQ